MGIKKNEESHNREREADEAMTPRCVDSEEYRGEGRKRKLSGPQGTYRRSELEQRPRLKQREGEVRIEGVKGLCN